MLYHVLPKELKAFAIPTKEYSVVLFNQLKGLNSLGGHELDLLVRGLKMFVFLHCQLLLNLEVVRQGLVFFLGCVGFVHDSNEVPLQLCGLPL